MNEQAELDELQIRTHELHGQDALHELIAGAQKVWTELYGAPRASHERLRGYKSKKRTATEMSTSGKSSVAEFLEKRRRVIRSLATDKSSGSTGSGLNRREIFRDGLTGSGEAWTEKHTGEFNRQSGLRTIRKLEAADRGLLIEIQALPHPLLSPSLCRWP